MEITTRLTKIRNSLPAGVRLAAVSKFHSEAEILEAYNAGQRVFGENRVQELAQKAACLPTDIEWHLIGHLQSNKVRQAVAAATIIESVDSLRLLEEIDREATKQQRAIDVLLQIHIAEEEHKFGFMKEEVENLLKSGIQDSLQNVRICGLMGMATLTDNTSKIRAEFAALRAFFNKLKSEYFAGCDYFCEVSMGMSDDYQIAIEEGSTTVRIGSAIFGPRNYNKN